MYPFYWPFPLAFFKPALPMKRYATNLFYPYCSIPLVCFPKLCVPTACPTQVGVTQHLPFTNSSNPLTCTTQSEVTQDPTLLR